MDKVLEIRDVSVVQAIEEITARAFSSIAFLYLNEKLYIAIPKDMPSKARLELKSVLAKDNFDYVLEEYPKEDIEKAINTYYSIMLREEEIQNKISVLCREEKVDELWIFLLNKALDFNASDIHINFINRYLVVKLRISGGLKTFCLLELNIGEALIRIIKLHSKMDISRVLGTKEGRMLFDYLGENIDLRVSIVRTLEKEKVHIRLLNWVNVPRKLVQLGLRKEDEDKIRKAASLSSGFILVCGPTGSGKSTTLRCIMSEIDNGEKHIVSLEDPIEYTVPNITQIQINEGQGFGFADALKTLLRIDPDVIYLGELRDKKSAEIATSAAITGHLVLSTLHTKTALSAIDRLMDLGVNNYSIASSLSLILNQRLVRILCESCKEKDPWRENAYIRIGCEKCNYTGISHREPLLEVIYITKENRQEIFEGEFWKLKTSYQSISQQVKELLDNGKVTYEEGVSLMYE